MTYFHMGNPYKFDGWTYEWQAGRQLKSMTHLDELGVQDKKLEFSYDAVGLRTQKKYTYTDAEGHAIVETTDYILHGILLTHQKTMTTIDGVEQEPYQLHFYYDKSSRPIMVRAGNEEAESQYYSYVHSFQGDILGIIDNEQDLVVEYAYDPWGKPLETRCLKTGCEMLAEMNPFRYRGYVLDDETGLYYLKSRYYNPEWERFVSADGLLGGVGKLFCHNLFAYCRNNPVCRKDDEGREGVSVNASEYEEFTDIFANTYGVDFEVYTQYPSLIASSDWAHETKDFKVTNLIKGYYIETDNDRYLEDTITTGNVLGLTAAFTLEGALSYGIGMVLNAAENSDRYNLGDIERDAFVVSYTKRDRFWCTDAYGTTILWKVDYTITEKYTIGAGRKNGKSYFDSRTISLTVVNEDKEIWKNGVKIKK